MSSARILRLSLAVAVVLCPRALAERQGEIPGEGVFYGEIVAIDSRRIQVSGIERDGTEDGGGGFRGRRGAGGGEEESVRISCGEALAVISGSRERRTGDFLAGPELPGGLNHPLLAGVGKGSSARRARLVLKNREVIEIAILVEDRDLEGVIAVRPKRPPSR